MLKVTKTPKTPNMVWDTANNRPLCKFVKGVIETNDETLAETLKALGHEVTGEVDAKPETDTDPEQTDAEQAEQTETATATKTTRRSRK